MTIQVRELRLVHGSALPLVRSEPNRYRACDKSLSILEIFAASTKVF